MPKLLRKLVCPLCTSSWLFLYMPPRSARAFPFCPRIKFISLRKFSLSFWSSSLSWKLAFDSFSFYLLSKLNRLSFLLGQLSSFKSQVGFYRVLGHLGRFTISCNFTIISRRGHRFVRSQFSYYWICKSIFIVHNDVMLIIPTSFIVWKFTKKYVMLVFVLKLRQKL